MQGALYYPYIRVPNNAWWTRTLLYWDAVATITPQDFVENPQLHDPFTLALISEGLLYQVCPAEADDDFVPHFQWFVSSLGPEELQRRQANFQAGKVARVHADKFVTRPYWFDWFKQHELAQRVNRQWCLLEQTTAAEFIASLALSLCEAADQRGWNRFEGHPERWVPVTDDATSAHAILSGLKPAEGAQETRVQLRVRGEQRRAEIFSVVLPQILPVPEGPVDIDAIVKFRRQHGGLLPQFRREMEEKFQHLADLDDPAQRQLEIDHLEDEVHEKTEQVSAYLSASFWSRIVKAPLVSLVKLLLPDLSEGVGVAQEFLTPKQPYAEFERDPLAYLAFANAKFAPVRRYSIDPFTGVPLVTAVTWRDEPYRRL